MTSAHFLVHRFTTDVEELDEQVLARLIASDAEFVASLCALDGLEGALVIDDASIIDDIGSATQRLCFEVLETLVVPGTTYEYRYFTSNTNTKLVSSADGATIALSGDDVTAREFPRAVLLPALYACGVRLISLTCGRSLAGPSASAACRAWPSRRAARGAASVMISGVRAS